MYVSVVQTLWGSTQRRLMNLNCASNAAPELLPTQNITLSWEAIFRHFYDLFERKNGIPQVQICNFTN